MKSYYVYILECSDRSYYTGITSNLDKRLYEHNQGFDRSCYTYSRRPLKLEFVAEFNDVNNAIEREKQIKGWTRQKKQALINGDFGQLVKLSNSHGSTSSP
ncbi:MAG: hypothetical protein A3A24_01990 [Candidatus Buchananbacteria bacterium RIFCSPLOWO2_01_FULL_46_12]|uniref:GIY-YIG domain-containing protein n=2 Tax=Candidatus Buchananiibacteriota TaxID=1817903 RepID=A0A1G1YSA5_9BACT|nr:MAG: hypothetical protein A2744_00110 [Candidatus Buchananbacteria bacterium RIFCSPHIGHO2_01_FULL_44_11]OGY55225.1 MAG: hypothetical protein A3A24_01990 [Candidatus Buchananbacteria bacterium RIFCSPLOWO2_01_FULL_46_12]